jgi:hypothetical protein
MGRAGYGSGRHHCNRFRNYENNTNAAMRGCYRNRHEPKADGERIENKIPTPLFSLDLKSILMPDLTSQWFTAFLWEDTMTRLRLGYTMFLAFVVLVSGTAFGEDIKDDQYPVGQLLTEIQRALIDIQNETNRAKLPPLNSVTLALSAEAQKDGKAAINLYFVKLGGGVGKGSSQTIKLKLVPPKPGAEKPVGKDDISANLVKAVLATANSVNEAEKRKPPLTLSELTATLKFVVTVNGTGGVKFEILPVGLDLGGEIKSSETQEIEVVFKKDDKP